MDLLYNTQKARQNCLGKKETASSEQCFDGFTERGKHEYSYTNTKEPIPPLTTLYKYCKNSISIVHFLKHMT